MGKYINKNSRGDSMPAKGKVDALINDGAERTDASFKENLVCVMDNGPFEAAGYAYSEKEFEEFARPDGRPKTWLVYPHVKEVAQ